MTQINVVRILHSRDIKELLHGEAVRLSLMGFEVENALPGADPAGELHIQISLCPDLMKILRPILAGDRRASDQSLNCGHTGGVNRNGKN